MDYSLHTIVLCYYLLIITHLNQTIMGIIGIRLIVYGTSPDNTIKGYYTNIDKAIKFANRDLVERKAKNISKLLPRDPDKHKYHQRIEYTSYSGDYSCAYEFIQIEVL